MCVEKLADRDPRDGLQVQNQAGEAKDAPIYEKDIGRMVPCGFNVCHGVYELCLTSHIYFKRQKKTQKNCQLTIKHHRSGERWRQPSR